MVFLRLRVLVRKLASPFGHPAQVSTQVQLATTYLRLLASPFGQGLTVRMEAPPGDGLLLELA